MLLEPFLEFCRLSGYNDRDGTRINFSFMKQCKFKAQAEISTEISRLPGRNKKSK